MGTRFPQLSIIKKVRFSSAHFFYWPQLSPEENIKRFGPTSNQNGHGHNYELEITVSGPVHPVSGMVMNLKDLKTILQEMVVQPLDFNSLNHDVPYFADKLPTLENLSQWIWGRLAQKIETFGLVLSHIRLYEADDLFVDFFNPTFDPASRLLINPEKLEKALPMIYLTRRYDFCATHRLYNPSLSAEENQTIFRECNNPNGHGHNYELEVTVAGALDIKNGMVVDLYALDQIVQEKLLSKVDHKNMNLDVDFLSGVIPTAELMVKAFWQQLELYIPGDAKLSKMRLIETKKNYAEYYGEG